MGRDVSHAHAHTPATRTRAAYGLPPPALRADNPEQHENRPSNRLQPDKPPSGLSVVKCAQMCKNVAKCFGDSEKMRTFASTMDGHFIITGVNTLTGQRDQLSRAMGEEEARERLQREVVARKGQRYAAHKRLRVERLEAVQLTINFDDDTEY